MITDVPIIAGGASDWRTLLCFVSATSLSGDTSLDGITTSGAASFWKVDMMIRMTY